MRLTTDTGLTGIGEATLEWQERTVQTLLHEWAEERILGICPFDIEQVFGGLIRDQYQGGPTVMTVISALEIACWDIIGKACGQPLYKLWGGFRDRVPGYASCVELRSGERRAEAGGQADSQAPPVAVRAAVKSQRLSKLVAAFSFRESHGRIELADI